MINWSGFVFILIIHTRVHRYIQENNIFQRIGSGPFFQNIPELLDTIILGLLFLSRDVVFFLGLPSILRVRFDQDPGDLKVRSFALLRALVLLIPARTSTHRHLRRLAF
jgi:hypothetical protein